MDDIASAERFHRADGSVAEGHLQSEEELQELQRCATKYRKNQVEILSTPGYVCFDDLHCRYKNTFCQIFPSH